MPLCDSCVSRTDLQLFELYEVCILLTPFVDILLLDVCLFWQIYVFEFKQIISSPLPPNFHLPGVLDSCLNASLQQASLQQASHGSSFLMDTQYFMKWFYMFWQASTPVFLLGTCQFIILKGIVPGIPCFEPDTGSLYLFPCLSFYGWGYIS